MNAIVILALVLAASTANAQKVYYFKIYGIVLLL